MDATFIETPERGFRAVTESQLKAPTPELVKVRVRENFRVVHEGNPYVGGDVLEVPNDGTTQTWLTAKWVEPVTVSQKGQK